MTGLTAEQKKTLDGLIAEYGQSLARIASESETKKAIEERAITLGIQVKNFRALAKACWNDAREIVRKELSDQIDLFDLYGDFEVEQARKSAAWLKKNGVDQITLAGTGALQ